MKCGTVAAQHVAAPPVISLTRLLGGTAMPVPEEEMFFRRLHETEGIAANQLRTALASVRRN